MPFFKPEYLLPAAAFLCLTGEAAAQCPSTQNAAHRPPGTPLLPAVTRIEIENPSAPSKPYPAIPGSPVDRAQTTGGVVGKSSLTLIVTLSSDVASGCELPFSVYDDAGPPINQRQIASEAAFPGFYVTSRPYLRVIANGSNQVRLTLPVAIRLGTSHIHRHRLGLSTPYSNQTPETPVPFEFQNNPVRIASIYRVGANTGPAQPGERVEIAVKTVEPIDPASNDYTVMTSNSVPRSNALKVRYGLSPTNLAQFPSLSNDSVAAFAPNFADGSSRLPIIISTPTPANLTLKSPTNLAQIPRLPTRPQSNARPVAPAANDAPQSVVVSAQLYTESTGEGGETLSLEMPIN
jgi:hypothetical protein